MNAIRPIRTAAGRNTPTELPHELAERVNSLASEQAQLTESVAAARQECRQLAEVFQALERGHCELLEYTRTLRRSHDELAQSRDELLRAQDELIQSQHELTRSRDDLSRRLQHSAFRLEGAEVELFDLRGRVAALENSLVFRTLRRIDSWLISLRLMKPMQPARSRWWHRSTCRTDIRVEMDANTKTRGIKPLLMKKSHFDIPRLFAAGVARARGLRSGGRGGRSAAGLDIVDVPANYRFDVPEPRHHERRRTLGFSSTECDRRRRCRAATRQCDRRFADL